MKKIPASTTGTITTTTKEVKYPRLIYTPAENQIKKQIDLSNYQMKKFKFIMDKYDSNIIYFKERGWIKDTTHDKYNNWSERFDAYTDLLKNNCKNMNKVSNIHFKRIPV